MDTTKLSDFELITKYQEILDALQKASKVIAQKHPYSDVQVSILGTVCTFTSHEIGVSIAAQIRTFERLIMQVQDRIQRSEGKVA
jgi:hypothetical protein